MPPAENLEDPVQFVNADQMCADLGDVHARILRRVFDNDPDCPPLIYINNRIHAERSKWEAFKRVLIKRGAKGRPFPKRGEKQPREAPAA